MVSRSSRRPHGRVLAAVAIFTVLAALLTLLPGGIVPTAAQGPQPPPSGQEKASPASDLGGPWDGLPDFLKAAPPGARPPLRLAGISTQSTGGPDGFGYTWDDSAPVDWIDATVGVDTGLSNSGPVTVPVSLDFSFKYYDRTYSQLWVSLHGYLGFNPDLWNSNGSIPSPGPPNDVIAPYWTNLSLDSASKVYSLSGGSAPDRYLVVQWHQVGDGKPGNTFTFQVILRENGDILFQYQTMSYGTAGRNCATTGIEDSSGTDGLLYQFCRAMSSNQAIRFIRPAPAARVRFLSPAQGRFTRAGATESFPLSVRNTGELGDDTYDLSASSDWPASLYAADGVTLLTDTDGDGAVDTGAVAPGRSVTVTVKVQSPAVLDVGDHHTASLVARSSLDTGKVVTATLQTANPAPFAQVYRTDADGAMSLYLAQPVAQGVQRATPGNYKGNEPAVAEAPSGNFVYAWSKWRCLDNQCNVHVGEIEYVLLNRYGETIRPVTRLTDHSGATARTYDTSLAVAVAPNGRIGMLWRRYLWNPTTNQYNSNVYLAILDDAGNLAFGPANLTGNSAWGTDGDLNVPRFEWPRIAATGDNRFVLAWQRSQQEAPTSTCTSFCWVNDIEEAVRDTGGGEIRAVTRITDDAAGGPGYYHPTLASLSGNRALLAYNGPNGISYAALDSSGNSLAAERTTGSGGWQPDAAQLSNGRILLAWTSGDERTSQISFALLDGATYGLLTGPRALANPVAPAGDDSVSVTADAAGRAILTWTDRDRGAARKLYYALLDGDGAVLTPPMIFRAGPRIETSYEGYGNTSSSWSAPAGVDGAAGFRNPVFDGPPGGTATLFVRGVNHGATTAANVILTATLDSNLVYISDTSGIAPNISGNAVAWNLPDLAFLADRKFTLSVRLPASATYGTRYPVSLTLTSAGPEANPGDNTATAEVAAAPATPTPTATVTPTATPSSSRVEFVGQIGGVTRAVAVAERNGVTYAYVGVGPRLVILDVSDPADPVLVGRSALLPGVVNGLAVDASHAYIAAGDRGLRILEVGTNPASPTEVGFFDTSGWTSDVAVVGNLAYLADGHLGLRILDVTNPAGPVEVGAYDTPGWTAGLAVAGRYVYLADSATRNKDGQNVPGSLRVVDVSDPAHPTEVGSYGSSGDARGVDVVGSYAYLADGRGGLRILDVTNPASPTPVSQTATQGDAWGVAVVGSYAYVADNWWGIRIVDVTNPASPVVVGSGASSSASKEARDVAVAGTYAYVAGYSSGLRIVDVADPTRPAPVGSFGPAGYASAVAVADRNLSIAASNAGLRIVDVADPVGPTEVGSFDTSGDARDVALTGTYAYLADGWAGLSVVDVADPTRPVLAGYHDTPGDISSVAVGGGRAYLAETPYWNGSQSLGGGLTTVDITNPANPRELSFLHTRGEVRDVAVAGSYVYIVESGYWTGSEGAPGGLRIVDVSNPASPVVAGSHDIGDAWGVAVAGPYAYVAAGSEGLLIVDVADPTRPTRIGSYRTQGYAQGVTVVGTFVYLAASESGLRILDVADPTRPAEVGYYDTPGRARSVAIAGSDVYVADGEGGVVILRFAGAGAGPTFTPTITPTPTLTPWPTETVMPMPTPTITATPTRTPNPNLRVESVRVSNLSDTAAVISWITTEDATGAVVYSISGTFQSSLSLWERAGVRAASTSIAFDDRGPDFVGTTHYVVLTGLEPSSTYQFQIDTDGALGGDDGSPYVFQTGPSLLPGAPNSVVGRLLDEQGYLAAGCLLYVRLSDGDSTGSAGDSAWLSALTDENGEWLVELQARTSDLQGFFDYQIGGDTILVESECGGRGIARDTYPTSAIDPAAGFGDLGDLRLRVLVTEQLTLVGGWNLVALPAEPMAPTVAEDLGQLLVGQGVSTTQVVRWNEALGAWSAHLVGRTSNNFAIDLTHGYFVRVTGSGGTASIVGYPIRSPQSVVAMVVGWNLIAVPYPTGLLAKALGQAVIADGITASQVVRWNESLGAWSAHLVGRTSNNFAVERGHGYFVRVTGISGAGEYTP
ncbi:MAG: hypothetical protein HYY04_05365 [Chloroflexi bacterium]|nr:hypothetical protein [Chloroflexota bacterium]